MAVPKSDGNIRLCGDYKVTVNPVLDVDQYPLPYPEDLMSSLTGGLKFSKLNLSSAYQQMPLDKDSREYMAINTHHGLYRYTQLPFGIASAQPFSKGNGERPARAAACHMLPGRHLDDRYHRQGALAEPGHSAQPAQEAGSLTEEEVLHLAVLNGLSGTPH